MTEETSEKMYISDTHDTETQVKVVHECERLSLEPSSEPKTDEIQSYAANSTIQCSGYGKSNSVKDNLDTSEGQKLSDKKIVHTTEHANPLAGRGRFLKLINSP